MFSLEKALSNLHIEGSPMVFTTLSDDDGEKKKMIDDAMDLITECDLYDTPDFPGDCEAMDIADECGHHYDMDEDHDHFVETNVHRDNRNLALSIPPEFRGDSSSGFDKKNRICLDAVVTHAEEGHAIAKTIYGTTYVPKKFKLRCDRCDSCKKDCGGHHACSVGCHYRMVCSLAASKEDRETGMEYKPKHPLITIFMLRE